MTHAVDLDERQVGISIHMPHTWHDPIAAVLTAKATIFQSTCHIRGMTVGQCCFLLLRFISIHMPHTWHDGAGPSLPSGATHFNPHATYVA